MINEGRIVSGCGKIPSFIIHHSSFIILNLREGKLLIVFWLVLRPVVVVKQVVHEWQVTATPFDPDVSSA
jgi:hypothetical protein